jgi:thioredoxin 1
MKKLMIRLLSAAFLVALSFACARQEDSASAEPVNESAFMKPITQDEFGDRVENAAGVVVVDFHAAWCGPCRRLAPILEKLAGEFQGRASFYKVDVDQNRPLAAQYKVSSIPYVVLFKDGKAVDAKVGLLPEEQYREWVSGAL